MQDADWLIHVMQNTNFSQIDQHEHYQVDIRDFTEYLQPMGLGQERIQHIFDEIDVKKAGTISVVSYNKWRSQLKGSNLQQLLNQL